MLWTAGMATNYFPKTLTALKRNSFVGAPHISSLGDSEKPPRNNGLRGALAVE